MQAKEIKIKADLFWPFLDAVSPKSGKYQVDLCNLSKNAIKALEDLGVVVRNKNDDRGFFVTAKSKIYPIKTVDQDGSPITCKVANGSKGVALIRPYEYKAGGESGIGVGINALMVTDLIEYSTNPFNADEKAL